MLPVEQHDVEVFGVGEAAELVELLLRIDAVAGRHLRHELVAVTRDALQGDAEHPVHLAVRFGRLEEADAAIVRMAHQPRETLLPELALYLAADAARAERQPGDFHAGPAQRDHVGRTAALGAEGKAPDTASVPAASPVFRNSRRVKCAIVRPPRPELPESYIRTSQRVLADGALPPSQLSLPRLTSKRQSLDTAGSALTGRHQPAAREHSHLFGLSRVRVHLLSAWFQRGTGDS